MPSRQDQRIDPAATRAGRLGRLLRSSTARSIVGVFFGTAVAKAVQFVGTILLIRYLTPEDFSAFVIFYSVRVLFPALVGEGMSKAMVRFCSEHQSRTGELPRHLYGGTILIECGLYLLVLAAGLLWPGKAAGLLYGRAQYARSVQLGLTAGLGYMLILVHQRVYQSQQRFGRFVHISWVHSTAILAQIAALMLLGKLQFVPVAACILASDLAMGGYMLADTVRVTLRPSGPREPRVSLGGDLLGAMAWLVGYHVALAAFSQLDVMMLSRLSDTGQLNLYSVAFRYYAAALVALGSIQTVLLPKFSQVRMQDHDRQRSFIRRWFAVVCWTAVPLLLADVLGRPVFVAVNQPRYAGAFEIWIILSVGVWISLMFSPMNNILVSRKRFATLFVLGIVGFVLNFAGNLLLIPRWGGRGAAVATVVAHGVLNGSAGILVWFGRPRQAQPSEPPEQIRIETEPPGGLGP